ncbi:MAG: hypothetical protein KatS3mg118_2616 [Paracoccaceae bacterium]|nr:MAG: hypothetical protein KatS3mg118_2616 [Paracoccaceae bacterium]
MIRADGEQLFKAAEDFLTKKMRSAGVSDPGAVLDKCRKPEKHDRDYRGLTGVMMTCSFFQGHS